jgi:hypothetical protein
MDWWILVFYPEPKARVTIYYSPFECHRPPKKINYKFILITIECVKFACQAHVFIFVYSMSAVL